MYIGCKAEYTLEEQMIYTRWKNTAYRAGNFGMGLDKERRVALSIRAGIGMRL